MPKMKSLPDVPESLHTKVKVAAALQGMQMKDWLVKALEYAIVEMPEGGDDRKGE